MSLTNVRAVRPRPHLHRPHAAACRRMVGRAAFAARLAQRVDSRSDGYFEWPTSFVTTEFSWNLTAIGMAIIGTTTPSPPVLRS